MHDGQFVPVISVQLCADAVEYNVQSAPVSLQTICMMVSLSCSADHLHNEQVALSAWRSHGLSLGLRDLQEPTGFDAMPV